MSVPTSQDFYSSVESAVQGSLQRIQQHPFILSAHAGTLLKSQAERWIKCAGRESRSFPNILENIIARSENKRVRAILQENLDDEYGNGNPERAHFRHYLQLLDNLDIPRQDFYEYDELAGIKLALALAYNLSQQQNQAIALGYMLVNEGMTPITYEAVQHALQRFYPEMDKTFFQLHVAVDEKHVAELYIALREFRNCDVKDILFGVSIGERGMAVLLDEALGIFDYCKDIPAYAP
jgi:pyrroloquinoline quinone (PQQ) biosynthesis protein C